MNLLLELESNIGETIHNAAIQYPGRYPKFLNLNGRFDITVWWKDGSPRGAIEVKVMKNNSLKPIKDDLKEIKEFLKLAKKKENSKIQFGSIVVYTDYYDEEGKADETVKRRINNILKECTTIARENGFIIRKWDEVIKISDEESAYGIAACMFSI
ncbi:MAG: hypothetical protein ABGX27_03845 [Desulfurobacteriaceae bacterium]